MEEVVQYGLAWSTTTIHAQAHSTAMMDDDVTREQFDDDAHTATAAKHTRSVVEEGIGGFSPSSSENYFAPGMQS